MTSLSGEWWRLRLVVPALVVSFFSEMEKITCTRTVRRYKRERGV